jgi:hypothetical protein
MRGEKPTAADDRCRGEIVYYSITKKRVSAGYRFEKLDAIARDR